MGFSFRKSFRIGPARLNLSKSGIGISAGVKGARVGVGPRGVTTSVGAKGLYYRKTVSPGSTSEGSSPASRQSNAELFAYLGFLFVGAVFFVMIGAGVWLLLR